MIKKLTRMTTVVALVTITASGLEAAEWKIDTAHSLAQFSVRHMMVSTVRGHFGNITGSIHYDPEAPDKASVVAEVDVASIDTRNVKRDDHLKSADFFDVEKYPTMQFESAKVTYAGSGRIKLIGNLTIHGVTKEVSFDVEGPASPIADGSGNLRSGATATAKISRKDFGLTWNRALESGGVVVGDEVTLIIDIEMISSADS